MLNQRLRRLSRSWPYSTSRRSGSSTSKSSVSTALTVDTSVCSSRLSLTGINCKLVWGISNKNFKPGLLYSRMSLDATPPTTGQIIFLPLAKSFKTQCIDEPSLILKNFLSIFTHARSVVPPTSRFATCLTEENLDRLKRLLGDAIHWEECAKVDSKLLCKGTVLQTISGATLEQLLDQPNILHILGEAANVFSCTEIGIPSPSSSTYASPRASFTVSPINGNSPIGRSRKNTPTGSNWLYLENYTYRPILQAHLEELLPVDPILLLSEQVLESLLDRMSEAQLSLNIWFAPYQQDGEVFEVTTDSIATAVVEWTTSSPEEAKERDEVIRAGEISSFNWVKDATDLKRIEHDFNVWNLGIQRCLKLKIGQNDAATATQA